MKRLIAIIAVLAISASAWAGDIGKAVEMAAGGEHRSEANIARNQYRHPVETLAFFGLEHGMTVMEIWPGGGWYMEILAPALKGHGKYIAASYDPDVPDQPGYRYRLHEGMLEKFASNPELWGDPGVALFSPWPRPPGWNWKRVPTSTPTRTTRTSTRAACGRCRRACGCAVTSKTKRKRRPVPTSGRRSAKATA